MQATTNNSFFMPEKVTLDQLTHAVTEATGITLEMLQSREKRLDICTARGVYYLLAKEMGIHPEKSSRFIQRSRSACILVAKQYKGYLDSGDKAVRNVYSKIKESLYAAR